MIYASKELFITIITRLDFVLIDLQESGPIVYLSSIDKKLYRKHTTLFKLYKKKSILF